MRHDTLYVTTTLPYVNADPHIGFALELCQADALVRYHLRAGARVFFNTGTDEHGLKIFEKAVEQNKDPQAYADEYAEKFKELVCALGLWEGINFIRTTDPLHKAAAQEFWKRCGARGDIYKKNYTANYCVGCELEKTDSELDPSGRCPLHPNRALEVIEEENYFFRFSKYQAPLLKLYAERPDFVVPDWRQAEIKAFVAAGLRDFSISRLREKMPWGVPVPGDEAHVMYVWFDALVSYISAIGWPNDSDTFNVWWPVVQFAGKDQVRQQAAIWQAMLMSAGIEPSKQILVHGFITSGGQKMSKSLGNVINPLDIIAKYGTDALRAFLLKEIPMFNDGDVTTERFDAFYNADLANGLGNLVSRVMTMAEAHIKPVVLKTDRLGVTYDTPRVAAEIWNRIAALDADVQKDEPFKLIKTDPERARRLIERYVHEVGAIAHMLDPIIPQTAGKIRNAIATNKAPKEPLFPRKR